MRGQLSAEMLIILALLLGLALIAFVQMTKNVKDVGAASEKKTQQLIEASELKPADVPCSVDVDCWRYNETWSCDSGTRYCNR